MLAEPLPPRPNLEHYRKRAKTKAKAENCTLASAQFDIARAHGFESWPKFEKHLEALAGNTPVSRFEDAADAIVSGDAATLQRLLREDPELAHATSTREHGATLLHYVGSNGVEDYRQRTPNNIVEIAKILLDAGAPVDATANIYGGGATTLGLAATSGHPVRAGVLEDLLQLLLDRGADIESAGIIPCLANGRPKAAGFLASRGARLDFIAAAGIGRIDLVRQWFDQATSEQRLNGFLYACEYGRNDVVAFLLEKDPALIARSGLGQTGLHMAVIGAQPDTVKLLLRYHPPLEATNIYGGTPLGQAQWSGAHGADPEVTSTILEALSAAGASI